MLQKIKSLWNNLVHDTTKEWEEDIEPVLSWGLTPSKVAIVTPPLTFKQRITALFTGRCVIRLLNRQVEVIRGLKLVYEDN